MSVVFDKLFETTTAGNLNRDFLITNNIPMQILYGMVILTTDATTANRRVILSILDEDSNVVIDIHAGDIVKKSETDRHHEFLQGLPRETIFLLNSLQIGLGNQMAVPKGWTIRTSIENGQAGDTFSTSFVLKELG